MAQLKGVKRFNLIYNNLNELFGRIYDINDAYPNRTCAIWFVDELNKLLSDSVLRSMLKVEQIDNIFEKGSNLLRTNLLEGNVKKELKILLKNLEEAKADLVQVEVIVR